MCLCVVLARCGGSGELKAPGDLAAEAASSEEIVLNWIDTSGGEDGFVIERQGEGGMFARIGIAEKNTTTYRDTGLACDTGYSYRIFASRGSRNSGYSNEARATTEACPPPLPPSDLQAVAVDDSRIDLNWTDASADEEVFLIERREGEGGYPAEVSAPANETGYRDTGLACETEYFYRVRAVSRYGASEYSNEAAAATGACPLPPPDPPSGLEASLVSSSAARIRWSDNSTDEEGFSLERHREGGTYAEITTVGVDVTDYRDGGLSCDVTYTYRVRAFAESRYSDFSPEVSITTPMCAPAGLTANAESISRIVLAWDDRSDDEDGFGIERLAGAAASWEYLGSVTANVASYTDSGLESETVASYRVYAFGPDRVSPYSNAVTASTFLRALAAGAGVHHTCAVSSHGGVRCWGGNGLGELGDGSTIPSAYPVTVSGLPDTIDELSCGGYHACVSAPVEGISCWGSNDRGQLGDGTVADRVSAVGVVGISGTATMLSGGGYHTCALVSSGEVECWGGNQYGQLGQGSADGPETCGSSACSTAPVGITSIAGAGAITCGLHHSCALIPGSGVRCWGRNSYGQLGDGTYTDSSVPVVAAGISGEITSISAGYFHTCAVDSGGGVICWGANAYGQLGDGTYEDRQTPVPVTGFASGGIAAVSAGYRHTCGLTESGGVKCWGDNSSGQLGDGTYSGSLVPVDVSGLLSGVVEVRAGYRHTCAVTSRGEMLCWGRNDEGQLGNGEYAGSAVPADVVGPGT